MRIFSINIQYVSHLNYMWGKCYCDSKPPPHPHTPPLPTNFTYSFSGEPNERAVSSTSKQHYKFQQMKVFRYDILQAYKVKLDWGLDDLFLE